ncbi:MAG: Gfo/Idh/MocA family oxidoreductase [Verrucomicrobia bacterium]|nr:Gfo/Idh/MocA family oxidoreductase [Verrucomicrobiota bacterium]
MSALTLGVIGCGHWGPNHIRVFSQLRDCEVAAISDLSERRLAEVGEMFPQVRRYRDHRELLADPALTAVVIVTPTKSHYAIVREALEAGKHVLCEKPLCTAAEEGRELVELARARGLTLMVGHIFLFNAGLLKVKELVEAGEVGAIRSLTAVRTNLGPVRSDVNAAWDLASHDIAIFNWLLDAEPLEVQAMGAAFIQPGVEDVVNISLKYPGGVLASIQCSWLDPKKVRQVTLVGSRRMITWDDLALSNPVAVFEKSVETKLEVSDYGEFLRLSMLDGDVRLPKVPTGEPLKAQDAEFLRAIREQRAPRSDGRFAVGVVHALQRIEQCLQPGRA